jgi:AcrR family transcriptional regulator
MECQSVSPRPYHSDQRRAAASQTRARIVTAARALLVSEAGLAAFSVDAVAREAGVARMTVYYQFTSRLGLLEALFDDLAERGGMTSLPAVFSNPDPVGALDAFIAAFCRFWDSDRLVIRRLRAAAAVDPELDTALRARDERRRQGLQVLVSRVGGGSDEVSAPESIAARVDVLWILTGFATFDALAESRRAGEVAALLSSTARAVLGAA